MVTSVVVFILSTAPNILQCTQNSSCCVEYPPLYILYAHCISVDYWSKWCVTKIVVKHCQKKACNLECRPISNFFCLFCKVKLISFLSSECRVHYHWEPPFQFTWSKLSRMLWNTALIPVSTEAKTFFPRMLKLQITTVSSRHVKRNFYVFDDQQIFRYSLCEKKEDCCFVFE